MDPPDILSNPNGLSRTNLELQQRLNFLLDQHTRVLHQNELVFSSQTVPIETKTLSPANIPPSSNTLAIPLLNSSLHNHFTQSKLIPSQTLPYAPQLTPNMLNLNPLHWNFSHNSRPPLSIASPLTIPLQNDALSSSLLGFQSQIPPGLNLRLPIPPYGTSLGASVNSRFPNLQGPSLLQAGSFPHVHQPLITPKPPLIGTHFTNDQVAILEGKYCQSVYIENWERKQLSIQTQLTEEQIRKWFARRRAKARQTW